MMPSRWKRNQKTTSPPPTPVTVHNKLLKKKESRKRQPTSQPTKTPTIHQHFTLFSPVNTEFCSPAVSVLRKTKWYIIFREVFCSPELIKMASRFWNSSAYQEEHLLSSLQSIPTQNKVSMLNTYILSNLITWLKKLGFSLCLLTKVFLYLILLYFLCK